MVKPDLDNVAEEWDTVQALLQQRRSFVTPTVYERAGRCMKALGLPDSQALFALAAARAMPALTAAVPARQYLHAGICWHWAGDHDQAHEAFGQTIAHCQPTVTPEDGLRAFAAFWFLGWFEDIVHLATFWRAHAIARGEDLTAMAAMPFSTYLGQDLHLAARGILQHDAGLFDQGLAMMAAHLAKDQPPYVTTGSVNAWDRYEHGLVLRQRHVA